MWAKIQSVAVEKKPGAPKKRSAVPSLLDVVDARENELEGGRESLTHLCYVATTPHITAAVEYHQKCVRILASSATGIMLAQDGVLVNYVECPAPDAVQLLKTLQAKRPLFPQVRILVSSEDCHERYIGKWRCHHVEDKADEGEVSPPEGEDATEAACDLLFSLADLGEVLSNPSKAAELASAELGVTRTPQEVVTAAVTDACPAKARAKAWAQAPAFFEASEWLEMFDAPVTVELESEDNWPAQQTIAFEGLA